jgi:hypothetical protein
VISTPNKAPGIEDYRLLTSLTAEELGEKVRLYETLGWVTLGTPYFLHAGHGGAHNVYIQPLVLFRSSAKDKDNPDGPHDNAQ